MFFLIGLTLQQKNMHIILLLGQVAIFAAHYNMQNYAVTSFITQDRAEGTIYKYPSLLLPSLVLWLMCE